MRLYVGDVQERLSFEPVDLIYAALVFEFVQLLEPTLRTLASVSKPNGILGVVLQLPSPSESPVSPSPFTSLQALGPVMRLVSPDTLADQAASAGFVLRSARRFALPSRKEFAVQIFQRGAAHPRGAGT